MTSRVTVVRESLPPNLQPSCEDKQFNQMFCAS